MDKHIQTVASVGVLVIIAFGSYLHTTLPDIGSVSASGSVLCAIPSSVNVTARAAFAMSLDTGEVLFSKNADAQLPLASLTKMVTALTAADVLSPDKIISVSSESLEMEGDAGLFEDELWVTKDLIDFTLITSSNDGAAALASAAAKEEGITPRSFVDRMNRKVRTIGLTQTYFLNTTGLDVSTTTASAFGSARDIGKLLVYAHEYAPTVLSGSGASSISFTSVSGFDHKAEHTSELNKNITGAFISKTGFTDLAGGNLATLAEPVIGKTVALVVLGSTKEARDEDIYALYSHARDLFRVQSLCNNK